MKNSNLILIAAIFVSVFIIFFPLYSNELFKNKFAPQRPEVGIEGQETIPYPWSLYLEILENMKTPIPPITEGVPPSIEGEEPSQIPISFDIPQLNIERLSQHQLTLEPCGITPDRPIKVRCEPEDCNDYSGINISKIGGYYVPEKCKLCLNKKHYDELFCVNSNNPNAGICGKDLSLQEIKATLEAIKNDINKPSPSQCYLTHEVQHIEDSNNDTLMKSCQSEINAEQKTVECYQGLNQKYCDEGHPDSISICGKAWQLNEQNKGYKEYCQQIQFNIENSQNKFIPFQQCLCNSPTIVLTLKHCTKCYNQIYPNNGNPNIFNLYCHTK